MAGKRKGHGRVDDRLKETGEQTIGVAKMQTEQEFVIAPDADSLLSTLSGDFGELILAIAVQHANERKQNVTEVVRTDVLAALREICDALENARAGGHLGNDAAKALTTLKDLCDQLASSGK